MQVFSPGDHGSTFGGSPLAAAVGLEALRVIEEEQLIERSAHLGRDFLAALEKLKSPLIRRVRGRGLFVGIEVDPQYLGARTVCERLLEVGILTKETHHTVIRLAPPLVIGAPELDEAVTRIQGVFDTLGRESRKVS